MPKYTRVNPSCFHDRATACPYSRAARVSDCENRDSRDTPLVPDETEWDEIICPICLEHPHNAVLLLCSSHDKGCRPFICDTSHRHSNCLGQLRKLAGPVEHPSELHCPLCRGVVTGWRVVQSARRCMDSKIRSCSLETCSFSGNYEDLRRHAREVHPSERPSEPNPTRKSDWAVMEQRELEDALAYHSNIHFEVDASDLEDILTIVSFLEQDSSPSFEESSNSGGPRSNSGHQRNHSNFLRFGEAPARNIPVSYRMATNWRYQASTTRRVSGSSSRRPSLRSSR